MALNVRVFDLYDVLRNNQTVEEFTDSKKSLNKAILLYKENKLCYNS